MRGDQSTLVVHVIHHLFMGGLENGLVNLINNLDGDRYRHVVVCVEDFSDFRNRLPAEVEVIPMYRSRIGVWALRRGLYRLFRRLRPDIVHTRNLSALDAIVPAWLAGVPQRIHGEHGFDVDDLYWTDRKKRLLRRLHRPFVGHYIAVSKHLRNNLISSISVPQSRVHQVYNGVDTDKFKPGRTAAAGPARIFGTVGRLQPVKDQMTMVRAFGRLLRDHPALAGSVQLRLVGEGPMREELTTLVDEMQLAGAVALPGAMDDPVDAYQGLDVFILPSLMEGISNTILEAMSSGLPVIASEVGGNLELVRHGETGWLFPPGDDVALARLMAGYAQDAEQAARHGNAARLRVEQEFSLARMLGSYDQIYRDCLT